MNYNIIKHGGVGYIIDYVEIITEDYINVADVPTTFAVGSKLFVISSNDNYFLWEQNGAKKWIIAPSNEDVRRLIAHKITLDSATNSSITAIVSNETPNRTLGNNDVVYAGDVISIQVQQTAGYTFKFYINGKEVAMNAGTYDFTVECGATYALQTTEEAIIYNITKSGTNLSIIGNDTATCEANYSANITLDEHYVYPNSIAVTINGATVTAGTEYTYDNTTGNIVINKDYILADIAITAIGTAATYNVSGILTNLTSDIVNSCTYGTDYSATLVSEEGYSLPETIEITIEDNIMTNDVEYTYDNITGAISIDGDSLTGDVSITADGVEIIEEPIE